jgi:2-hydroxychromene-2-carboxylate isomerase
LSTKLVDYYFSPSSPWSFLGHARFAQIARRYAAAINVKPVDFGTIFPQSGGLPLGKRAPQRQAYRLVELRRWKTFLGVPLNLEPKYFPVDATRAACLIIAAEPRGADAQMRLAEALMRGLWCEEKNLADAGQLEVIAGSAGFDAAALLGQDERARERYESFTREALTRGVFGAPTYVYRDELFWGQDRLDFLERALAM